MGPLVRATNIVTRIEKLGYDDYRFLWFKTMNWALDNPRTNLRTTLKGTIQPSVVSSVHTYTSIRFECQVS